MSLCRQVGGTTATWLLAKQVSAACQPGQRVAELGCGCGEGLLHAMQGQREIHGDGLEIQPDLVTLAQEKTHAAGLQNQVTIHQGDVRQPPAAMAGGSYHHIFCNPPFRLVGEGRLPPDPVRAAARFELNGTTADFITCGRRLLVAGGDFHMVHVPERLPALLVILQQAEFGQIALTSLLARRTQEPVWVLLQATLGAPFAIHWRAQGWEQP